MSTTTSLRLTPPPSSKLQAFADKKVPQKMKHSANLSLPVATIFSHRAS